MARRHTIALLEARLQIATQRYSDLHSLYYHHSPADPIPAPRLATRYVASGSHAKRLRLDIAYVTRAADLLADHLGARIIATSQPQPLHASSPS